LARRIMIFKALCFLLSTAFLLVCGAALAQTPVTDPSFDVATIKPSAPLDLNKLRADAQAGKMPRLGPHVDAFRAESISMKPRQLIAIAYHAKEYQISGPDWLGEEHFDSEATLPEGADRDLLR
jgi:uncharacterized protein (TIGR03435 family)